MGMHVRAATTAVLAAVVTTVIAGCGGASPGGGGTSGAGGPTSTSPTRAITGVVVQTDAHHSHPGKAVAGVKVGLYLQAVHAGGPIAVDPPRPIATVTTDGRGTFRFHGLRPGKRYFVFAVGARGYSIGHWTLAGQRVRLVACTDCVMPL
jgi:hypothetical protein